MLLSNQYNLDLKPPSFIWRQEIHALHELLSGLLKQKTKFFFRQDTMFSSDMHQRYICMQI